MTFEEWNTFIFPHDVESARVAWDFQQVKIEEAAAEIQRLRNILKEIRSEANLAVEHAACYQSNL